MRGHLRRIIRRVRAHWPTTKITIRGDSHYGRREVRDWCEDNGLDYVFGLPGNKLLAAAVEVQADDIRTRRALEQIPILRGYAQTNYAANSWKGERRVCARIEATGLGLDIHFVVTNITNGSAEHICDTLSLRACANGKSDQVAQDPAGVGWNFLSCAARQSDAAHLDTAAYWLMLDLCDNIPKTHALAVAEFATLREKLLKIGARVVETASRIRLALATRLSTRRPVPASGWHLAARGP